MSEKPSRKEACKQSILEIVSNFDRLPDSSFVRPQVIAAHGDISMATYWRRVRDGVLPRPKGGRVNVGEYRRAIAADSAA